MNINEDQLEQLCLSWFDEGDWQVLHGPDIAPDGDAPERADYQQVVLPGRLLEAMRGINPRIPTEALEEAVHAVVNLSEPTLIQGNRAFHKLLLEGVPVEFRTEEGTKNEHARLIDFEDVDANNFCVVNQFTVAGTKQLRRPDVVVFINGLPIVVIELKNPADEGADIWDAFNQIQTYKDEISDLFVFNEALVISDGLMARVGSLTANRERFMRWRTIENEQDKPLLEYQLETLVRGFFDRELLLDYLRYFVLFETDDDKIIKKIAGYHQFHAVREAVKATVIASQPECDLPAAELMINGKQWTPGSRKAGVVWHTQGSGKSISMCCYAGKLLQQPAMKNPTLVIVTDRNDLDGQLFQTFTNAKELLKQTPVQADGRENLREELSKRQAGGIIFTTVQKFSLLEKEEGHPSLSDRNNIVVISDEAHRSQYGLKAKLDPKTGKYIYGYAKHMRDALPNASFIGFTGTPVALNDKDTQAVFGEYVSVYDIQDAVDDGATVKIFYESRLAKLDINQDELHQLNEDVDEVLEDDEDGESTKSQWAALAKVVGAEPRIQQIAVDLVEHFEERQSVMSGKAMIVCMSRDICVQYFNALIELRPEWAGSLVTKDKESTGYYNPQDGAVRIVMTGSASDNATLQPHIYNKRHKKVLEKRFKNPDDELQIVIVRDMWLTGFDAPCCHTMYVDKPMKGHNLMQAIARVNRVFKDKEGGLVVDYLGIANELKEGLKTYTEAKGKGNPANMAEEAFSVLLEKVHIVRAMFNGFDYSAYETDALKLLLPAANHILGLKDGKKRFLDEMTAVTRAFSLCGTLDEAKELRTEIAFLSAVKMALTKNTAVDNKRSEAARHSALKQIIDNAVISEGVEDIFALAGLDKPNIGLLSEEFMQEVRDMPHKNLAVELLEKLMRDEIKSRSKTNVVQEKKFTDRLLATLTKYHNRSIETAQVIEELIQMAKDYSKESNRRESLGMNDDEIAFYDALASNESAVREMQDDILKKIAQELTEKIRNSTTVDWQKRDSIRAKLRNIIRRLLKKYKYPPDQQDEAVKLVMKQAETLADQWSQ